MKHRGHGGNTEGSEIILCVTSVCLCVLCGEKMSLTQGLALHLRYYVFALPNQTAELRFVTDI